MFNKVKPLMLLTLAVSCLVLLGYSLVWAQPPRAQEIIYGANNDIKVQFDQDGKLLAVYFLEEDCTPDDVDDCWRQATAKKGTTCVCVGADCEDDLQDNVDIVRANNPENLDLALECHDMKTSGPRSTGCPLTGSRGYSYEGDFYTRR